MANENSALEEAMDNLREAGQRIRATQHLLTAGFSGHEPHHMMRIRGLDEGFVDRPKPRRPAEGQYLCNPL